MPGAFAEADPCESLPPEMIPGVWKLFGSKGSIAALAGGVPALPVPPAGSLSGISALPDGAERCGRLAARVGLFSYARLPVRQHEIACDRCSVFEAKAGAFDG